MRSARPNIQWSGLTISGGAEVYWPGVHGYPGITRLSSCSQVHSGRSMRPERCGPTYSLPLAEGQRCSHIASVTGVAYLCPYPALLTMMSGHHGYRVRRLGMEHHIASNQGAASWDPIAALPVVVVTHVSLPLYNSSSI